MRVKPFGAAILQAWAAVLHPVPLLVAVCRPCPLRRCRRRPPAVPAGDRLPGPPWGRCRLWCLLLWAVLLPVLSPALRRRPRNAHGNRPPTKPRPTSAAGDPPGKNHAGFFRRGILRARSDLCYLVYLRPPIVPPNRPFSRLEIPGAKNQGRPRGPPCCFSRSIPFLRLLHPPPLSGAPGAAPGIGRRIPAKGRSCSAPVPLRIPETLRRLPCIACKQRF